MSMKILDKDGLEHFWTKLKAYFAPKAHTHNAFEIKHSYTTAANAAKAWYRIANASTQQLDTSKPIHAQFILTAYNTSYAADYYERWFVNVGVFGRTANIVIFGATSVPFSQARVLYENTVANIDANDRPALDIYLNYVFPNGTTKIEIEEVYNNGGWTFLADGQLATSTVPSGFESVACSIRNNGVERSTYADYVSYLNRQVSHITAAFTLADSYLYRSRTLNCTGTFTITIPSINSGYMWCVIKNKNATSGVITLHPSTTSVLIDNSNADITLQPGEYVCIHSAGANSYSLIADGRWKSQKADKVDFFDAEVVAYVSTDVVDIESLYEESYDFNNVYSRSSSNKTLVYEDNYVFLAFNIFADTATAKTLFATFYVYLPNVYDPIVLGFVVDVSSISPQSSIRLANVPLYEFDYDGDEYKLSSNFSLTDVNIFATYISLTSCTCFQFSANVNKISDIDTSFPVEYVLGSLSLDTSDNYFPYEEFPTRANIVSAIEDYNKIYVLSRVSNFSIDPTINTKSYIILDRNAVFSFSSPTVQLIPHLLYVVDLYIDNSGGFTMTWPSSVKWSGGATPAFSTTGMNIVRLSSLDAGTTWYGEIRFAE